MSSTKWQPGIELRAHRAHQTGRSQPAHIHADPTWYWQLAQSLPSAQCCGTDFQPRGSGVLFRAPLYPWLESHEGTRRAGGGGDDGHGTRSGASRPTPADAFAAAAHTPSSIAAERSPCIRVIRMIGHWPENGVRPEFAFCRRHCQNFTGKAVGGVYFREISLPQGISVTGPGWESRNPPRNKPTAQVPPQ